MKNGMRNVSITATLPIYSNGELFLDGKLAREFGESLASSYTSAYPYPHIVIDDFLPYWLIDEILEKFPVQTMSGDKFYENEFSGLHKRQVLPFNCEERIQTVFNFFNSSPFIRFLEGLTGIDSLIADPHFGGGGFHEIFRGGHLGVHSDYRIHTDLHLERRINVLLYLNKNWKEEYGGELEIWNKNMSEKVKGILPLFNRCVVFNTDSHSFHGHPDPLNTPAEVTRKSIALYYYTASKKVYEDTPSYSTMYVARPRDSKSLKLKAAKLRMHNYLNDWLPPVGYRLFKKIMKGTRDFVRIIRRK